MKGKNWEYSVIRYLYYLLSGIILEGSFYYLKFYIPNSKTIFKKYFEKYFYMLREDIKWKHISEQEKAEMGGVQKQTMKTVKRYMFARYCRPREKLVDH